MFYRSHRCATALLGFVLCTAFTHTQPTLASAPSSALDANSRLITIFGGGTKPLNQTSIATELSPQATANITNITKLPNGDLLASYFDRNRPRSQYIVEMGHNGRLLTKVVPHTAAGSKVYLSHIDCTQKAHCFAISPSSVKGDVSHTNQTQKIVLGSYTVESGLFTPLKTLDGCQDSEYSTSLAVTNSDNPTVLIACENSIYSFQTNESVVTAEKLLYSSETLVVGSLSQINGGPITALLTEDKKRFYTGPIKRLIVGLDGSVQERDLPASLKSTQFLLELYAIDGQGQHIFVSSNGISNCSSDDICQSFTLSSQADQPSNISTSKDLPAIGDNYRAGMVYDADNETLGKMNQLVHHVSLPWNMPMVSDVLHSGENPVMGQNRLGFYNKLLDFQDDGSLLFSQGPHGNSRVIRAIVPAQWQEFPTAGFNHISAEQLAQKQLPTFASRAGSITIGVKRVTGKYQFGRSKKSSVPIFRNNETALNSPFSLSVAATPVAQGSSEITIPQTLEPGIYDLDLTFTGDNDVIVKDHYRVFYRIPFSALSPKYIHRLAVDLGGDGGGSEWKLGSYTYCHLKTCEYGTTTNSFEDYDGNSAHDYTFTFRRYRLSSAIEGITIKPFGVKMKRDCSFFHKKVHGKRTLFKNCGRARPVEPN